VLSARVLFFHSFNMSANSSPLFRCHSGNILPCQMLDISQLHFCSYSGLHNTPGCFYRV
jgi:hypothetical protein